MDMEMYGRLAVAAAPFVLLLYCMPYKAHVLVKVVLALLWLGCLRQLRSLILKRRRASLRSLIHADAAWATQPETSKPISGSHIHVPLATQPEAPKPTSPSGSDIHVPLATQPKAPKPVSPCGAIASQPVAPKPIGPIELKLSIDKKRKQVLFAECNKDFVDVLLSFLTLPMGTIIRLANKKSGVGSMDELYKSVEAFDEEYFWTKAGKSMLLHPRSACGLHYKKLVVKIDETDYSKLYKCRSRSCLDGYYQYFSLVKNSICSCGGVMDIATFRHDARKHIDQGFINDEVHRFIIRDDLKVLPASILNTLSWLRRRGIRDSTDVEETIVNIGLEEVLHLLHRSMISKTPLTDVLLVKDRNIISGSISVPYRYQREVVLNYSSKEMKVELWFIKSTNRVICVEAEQDFIDFLFSFLTIPSGAIITLLQGHSSVGSMDNLYKSIKKLSELQTIYTDCQKMLLCPQLEHMFGCSNKLLEIEEKTIDPKDLSCGIGYSLKMINPKSPGKTTSGGGYMRRHRLLVTDNLEIKLLSPASDIRKLDGIPFDDIESISVTVGEEEALNLLQASLISKNVLSHAFSPKVINRSEGLDYN